MSTEPDHVFAKIAPIGCTIVIDMQLNHEARYPSKSPDTLHHSFPSIWLSRAALHAKLLSVFDRNWG
ncbi:hypothetical protein M7I_3910 [Glarea lozoyensis 74030]|uniref:Uncharacterized protein n=1 Tax=Glarea lozoyensis (strain ATCC 74030 / MF5533) TaxID=1104152 RepID=H0EMR6_GLAL7|nr:hypothetical protein M7I_3910 [Glarea lozoyensis 74030]